MLIFQKDDWNKLHIAKINGWTLTLMGDQNLLGWVMLFPSRKLKGPITLLTNDELIEFKKVALLTEELLNDLFQPDWFNYSQLGNHDGTLHIHLVPRYKSNRVFDGFTFTDENWGNRIKYLPIEKLARKETVLKIVQAFKDKLKERNIQDLKIEIL